MPLSDELFDIETRLKLVSLLHFEDSKIVQLSISYIIFSLSIVIKQTT